MASTITPNFTQWLDDTACPQIQQYNSTHSCTSTVVTQSMVDFLNLTTVSLSTFKQAYCINPPEGDNCPFGYCPNPDVAGKLPLLSTLHFIFILNIRGDYLRSPRPYSRYILALTLRISSGWSLPSLCNKYLSLYVNYLLIPYAQLTLSKPSLFSMPPNPP